MVSWPRDKTQVIVPSGWLVAGATRKFRLAHGWELTVPRETPVSLVRESIRPAVGAVPSGMARQLGHCVIRLAVGLGGPELASEWTGGEQDLRISIASRCGFGTPASLRAHFARTVGIPPITYRRNFRTPPDLSLLDTALLAQ